MSENLDNLLRGYEAFNRGDASIARASAYPDVEWGTTGTFPGLEGVYHGPDAIPRWMETIRSAWDRFEVSLDEVVHDEGDALAVVELLRGRGRESGAEVEMRVFAVYLFENGRVRRRLAFTDREAALRAVAEAQ